LVVPLIWIIFAFNKNYPVVLHDDIRAAETEAGKISTKCAL